MSTHQQPPVPQQDSASHHTHEDGVAPHTHDPETALESGDSVPETHEQPARCAVRIPRSSRRGFLARLALIPEVANPYEYKDSVKWAMTVTVALAATTSAMGSAIFYPALPAVAEALNTSTTVTNFSVAFYLLSLAITPLWWSSLSEKHGRRTVYMISFSLFIVFSVASALSVNIAMLIVMRILTGASAASVQSVGAGTVADIWEPRNRGKAMGIFYIGPLCGPGIAPIIGGALAQGFGWRSTLWFLVIFGGVLLLLILFCLPETLARRENADASLETADATEKGVSWEDKVRAAAKEFIEPLMVLGLLRHPPISITVSLAAIAFGSLYVTNISIETTFSRPPYSFSSLDVGLLYLAPTLGYAVSSVLGGRWIDYIMHREAIKANRYDENGKLVYLPEDRLKENVWIAASLYPAGLITFGWTAWAGVHWIVPSIANLVFGVGNMLIFGAVATVLTEFTPQRSSSGVAVNTFARSLLGCVGAIITDPLIKGIGVQWTCTMVALFAWLTANASVAALLVWGTRWREAMKSGSSK